MSKSLQVLERLYNYPKSANNEYEYAAVEGMFYVLTKLHILAKHCDISKMSAEIALNILIDELETKIDDF